MIHLKVQETSQRFRLLTDDSVSFNIETGIPIYPEDYRGSYEVTPTETEQTLDTDGLMMADDVTIGAIDSEYVGSDVPRRDETDLSASGATVTVPAGYYAEQETKSVANGTAGTPTATKSAVSNHSLSVTPSVTNTSGYITGSTKTGTAVTVSASELVSGSQNITSNANNIDVTNIASVNVQVPSSSVTVTQDVNTKVLSIS